MNFLKLFAKHRVWFILLGILVVTILMSPNFLTVRNISNVLLQTSINGIIALGMTFLLISGDFDLSVGSVMALSAALAIGLQSRGILTACIIAVVLGSAIGLLNGFLVTKAKINAFIVTLGTMTMVRGIVLAYTNQRPISGTNSSFLNLSGSSWLGIPIPAFIFFAGVIVSHIILTYNSLGRNCFAIGGNREASIFSGIRVDRYRICLLYTSDAADELHCVDPGGRRLLKKKKNKAAYLTLFPQNIFTTYCMNNTEARTPT